MIRKTRKNKKNDRYIGKKGGAAKKFPGITSETTLEEFENKWDVFYIRAHGGILNDELIIPNNTYILNTIPTAEYCAFPIDDKKLDLLYEEKYKTNFMDFIKNPHSLVPYLYTKEKLKKLTNEDIVPFVTSIYEPSDNIFDMSFTFNSHIVNKDKESTSGRSHFIVPGIFKIPISSSIKNTRNELLKKAREKISFTREELQKPNLNKETEGKIVNELDKLLKSSDEKYINIEGNLLKDIRSELGMYKSTVLLSDILKSTYTQPTQGKKRLFLIHACKVIIGKHTGENVKSHRAISVARILSSKTRRKEEKHSQNEWNIARNLAGKRIVEKTNAELEEALKREEAKQAAIDAVERVAKKETVAKKKIKKPTLANMLAEEGY
jgi:hypothetical protein